MTSIDSLSVRIGNTTTWSWDINGTAVVGVNNTSGNNTVLLNLPTGVVVDASNTLYISDYGSNRIQKQSINAWTGMTVAGQSSGTGGSSATTLLGPNSIVLDSGGNVYIADTRNHRIQFFYSGATTGVTIAGTAGETRRFDVISLLASILYRCERCV
jgi:hypothetical protein